MHKTHCRRLIRGDEALSKQIDIEAAAVPLTFVNSTRIETRHACYERSVYTC